MPVAVTPPLTPIEEEREGSLPSPIQPLAWKCCQCNLLNYFFDDNYAWFNSIAEYCIRQDCPHQRCSICHDPGPLHWPIRYADGRPIQHLFNELQETLPGTDDEDGDATGDGCEGADGSDDSSGSCATYHSSSREATSDEEYWGFLMNSAEGLSRRGDGGRNRRGAERRVVVDESFPCPLRELHFCPERFGSQEEAWAHSNEHVGQETVQCTRGGCQMTFSGKEAMRLHFIAMHS